LTPILSNLIARLANAPEILPDLRLVVMAAIDLTCVSAKPMIAAPMAVTPPSMVSAIVCFAPELMTLTPPVMTAPFMITLSPPPVISMMHVTPELMMIAPPVMSLPFSLLAMLPPGVFGISCLGDSRED
jgi:hypothetical protein